MFFRVFRVFPWLIIKIRIMWLTPHAHQLSCALFVRRRRVPLVNKHYENDVLLTLFLRLVPWDPVNHHHRLIFSWGGGPNDLAALGL